MRKIFLVTRPPDTPDTIVESHHLTPILEVNIKLQETVILHD